MAQQTLSVALPVPLRQLFDYLPPQGWDPATVARLEPGVRVKVPFGKQEQVGILLGTNADCRVDRDRLRHASAILDREPVVAPDILALADWAAGYYHHPPGEVLQQVLPPALRSGRPLPTPGEPGWQITSHGLGTGPLSLARAPAQRALLEILREVRQATASWLAGQGHRSATARALAQKGLIEKCNLKPGASTGTREPEDPRVLNPDQAGALNAIVAALGTFECFLLSGVTGSGKTEVYLQAIDRVLASGGQALLLVPEIGLTPQTISHFQRRFRHAVMAIHSGLADGDKLAAWQLAASGQPCVIIGTRSALFTPLPRLALLVVDEEHDLSFKQQEGFRYSARDGAVMRARLRSVPVILGSATPSLESLHNSAIGRYRRLDLPARAGNAVPPTMRVVDLRNQVLVAGLAETSRHVMAQELALGNQVLVFINRRGYAPAVICQQCGWTADCPHCDIPMTVHLQQQKLWCHHCDHRTLVPRQCQRCGNPRLLTRGQGTEKLEHALVRELSPYPVLRIDSDNIRTRGRLEHMLQEVHSGNPCVLVGTQVLAKGHHLPDVTLVIIVDADSGLYNADFRSVERTGQLLLQVAGRAGRADKPGQVLLQTLQPDQPLLQPLLAQDYDRFAAALLAQRRQLGLPPHGFLALLRAESEDESEGLELLRRVCRETQRTPGVVRVGPLLAPMARKSGRYRFQLILKSPRREPLHKQLDLMIAALSSNPPGRKTRWSVDVDPQDLG